MELSDIIDQHAEPQKVVIPPREVVDVIMMYRCEQDQYDVYYVPSLGEATYKFANGDEIDVDHLTKAQVLYYVLSGYWK